MAIISFLIAHFIFGLGKFPDSFLFAILIWAIKTIYSIYNSTKALLKEAEVKIRAMETTHHTFLQETKALIKKEVYNCSIKDPSSITLEYWNVIQKIFENDNPKMQLVIIDFIKRALDGIINDVGFTLYGQTFKNYKKNAEDFYRATKKSIKMTCKYSPLDYLRMHAQPKNHPEHLPLFNGMSETGKNNSGSIKRVRVMCITESLKKEIEQFPEIFVPSFIWFLIFNTRFELYWCYETIREDRIIHDEEYGWGYWEYGNNEGILQFLHSKWKLDKSTDGNHSNANLQNNLLKGPLESYEKHPKSFYNYVNNITTNDGIKYFNDGYWLKFVKLLDNYLELVLNDDIDESGFYAFQNLAIHMKSQDFKKAPSNTECPIKNCIDRYVTKLSVEERTDLINFFIDFESQKFLNHLERVLPTEEYMSLKIVA